ncbi:MAG TPA: hypothetical protein VHN11_15870 [Xanthobacteraceae bacterium]|nr:hypothetical protein [Xanthobacteraceae bacterium]
MPRAERFSVHLMKLVGFDAINLRTIKDEPFGYSIDSIRGRTGAVRSINKENIERSRLAKLRARAQSAQARADPQEVCRRIQATLLNIRVSRPVEISIELFARSERSYFLI